MTLQTRLAKLEAKRERILQCLWCQYALRQGPPEEMNAAATDDLLMTKCWNCGTRFSVSLVGKDKYEREVTFLVYDSHPSKKFTEERIHAAFIFHNSLFDSKRYEPTSRATTRDVRDGVPAVAAPPTLAAEKLIREREELKRRAIQFHKRTIERTKLLANGPESFPIDQTISQIKEECDVWSFSMGFTGRLGLDVNDLSRVELEETLAPLVACLQALKIQEACAMILWGEIPSETIKKIELVEQQISDEFDAAVKAVKRRQEKAARERQDREKEAHSLT